MILTQAVVMAYFDVIFERRLKKRENVNLNYKILTFFSFPRSFWWVFLVNLSQFINKVESACDLFILF